MKPVDFSIIYAVVAHPNKETIIKLRIKMAFISIHLLDNPIILFPRAFLHILKKWSLKLSFQSNLTPSNFSHSYDFSYNFSISYADFNSYVFISIN